MNAINSLSWKTTLRWIPALVWTSFIIQLLVASPQEIPGFPWLKLQGMDKLIHALGLPL